VDASEQVAHKFSTIGANSCNNDEYNPYHSNWDYRGYCGNMHGTCYVGRLEEHEAAVVSLLAAGDVEGLASYTLSYPGQVRLNFARGSVQMQGCGGKIVGNLPVPLATLKAVEVAVAEELKNVAFAQQPSFSAGLEPLSFIRYLEMAGS
jgi:hypothetical protein